VLVWSEPWHGAQDTAGTNTWNLHTRGLAYHDSLIVMLGVSQDGHFPESVDWHDGLERWACSFGIEGEWDRGIALPEVQDPGDRPRLLGQALVWTGEWDAKPSAGWRTFGEQRHEHGQQVALPWGLVQTVPAEGNIPALFSLHVAQSEAAERNRFLYTRLLVLIMEFAKAGQFSRSQYDGILRSRLNQQEATLLAAARSEYDQGRRILGSERIVRRLTHLIFNFLGDLADLEEFARVVELARDNMVEQLTSGGAVLEDTKGLEIVVSTDRLARQMRSDLDYYRTTLARAQDVLEAEKSLIGIELARVGSYLTIAGIVLAVFFGLEHLMELVVGSTGPGAAWHPVVQFLLPTTVSGIAALVVFRVLIRLRSARLEK
jgi:hypothetical protein